MMEKKITVRQWQEMFQAGIFHQDDFDNFHIIEQAGWKGFYDPLNNKGLQNLSKLVMSVNHPFILDNYHVYFLHHTPGVGPMYGCAYFELLSAEWDVRNFHIALDCPNDRKKWALMTRRYGDGAPEFECGNIRRMAHYVNNMANELEQGIQPAFIAGKKAVNLYTAIHGEPAGCGIYREGEHRYSYTSLLDGHARTVIVVSDSEGAPPDFVPEQAEQIKGLYVYCPQDAGKPAPQKAANKSHKRKEAER